MRLKFLIFLGQCALICVHYNSMHVNGLVGQNIRHAEPNEYLFTTCIIRLNDEEPDGIEKICIGTLISRKDVLTAAHCMYVTDPAETVVVAGSIDFRLGVRYTIFWWMPYEGWAVQSGQAIEHDINDIAVIRLIDLVPENISPVPISQVSNSNYYGIEATVVSWSTQSPEEVPTILDVGNVKIMTDKQCSRKCSKLLKKKLDIHWRFFCSFAEPYMTLECGDSGGPLVYNDILIGINNGFCPPSYDYPVKHKVNIHVGIQYYKTFIDQMLATP